MGMLIKSVSTLVPVLLLMLSTHLAFAQVTFETSLENHPSTILLKFSNEALIQALESGTIKPEDVLKIYVGVTDKEQIGDSPSIWGTYKINPGQITFEPLVPFSESLPYLAVFGDSVVYPFQFDRPGNRPLTRLLEIYPTTDTVPANLLKLYLKFSEPMREGEVYERVQLYHQNGGLVQNPFVPLQPELWDSMGHTVTLWLDPGRVKRALGSRETHGLVIEEGESYRLVVDPLWKDAHGQPLEAGFTKQFYVIDDDRIKPETKAWQLSPPVADTQDPVIISFEESMDFLTAQHALSVWSPISERLVGQVAIIETETIWQFVPEKPWQPGKYHLKIYSKLEDLAGNNLNRLFDRDLSIEVTTPSDQEFHWIDFEVAEVD